MNELDKIIEKASILNMNDYYLDCPDISDEKEIIAYYKLERKAYRYARQFFSFISIGDKIQDILLPIVFRDLNATMIKAVIENTSYTRGGFGRGNGFFSDIKQAVIFIDLPRQNRATLTQSLKQYIRHEIIHYYLWLKGYPFQDSSAMFWAYSYIYDGGAYYELDEEEENKYNDFLKAYNELPEGMDYITIKSVTNKIILQNDGHNENIVYTD